MDKETKKLIFLNLLNGVEKLKIERDFNITAQEVNDTYNFVIEKIKLCRFKSSMPHISLNSLDDARKNRLELITLLEKVTADFPDFLDNPLKEKIVSQPYLMAA